MSDIPPITVVLAGNPNSGKTALFNALTGSRQKVGNWPGVTVDRKTGHMQQQGRRCEVVDLPGTYSLSVPAAQSALDERLACEYLLSGEADVIVNVIDASNLERNLYLTLQLLEMQIPTVLAVNMLDVIEQRGIEIDLKKLARQMGCPVVGIIANQGKGLDQLKAAIITAANMPHAPQLELPLPKQINIACAELRQHISQTTCVNSQWLALRLLEDDAVAKQHASASLRELAQQQAEHIYSELGDDADILIADARYTFANQAALAVTRIQNAGKRTWTQVLDRLVLNRYLGIPIFLFVMYLMFLFAINVGGAFQDFFDIGSTTIFVDGMAHWLTQLGSPNWLTAILANGVGKGINTTITFIPVIGGMFLFLSFLEDSGYMARAAFVMDRFMRALGLPGKSFVPMIVGFGCNVPAVMGARTLANRRDRVLTVMMMPFMSCGARLAIFAVFAAAFFPHGGQDIIFILYLLGILVAVLTGLILRKSLLAGESAPMVMELPPYHMPKATVIFRHAWWRLKHFLTRAGKVIVPVCVLIGALNAISIDGQLIHSYNNQKSVLSEVGKIVTPVLEPLGVKKDNWPATVGLVTGILAKEVVVGTLNTLYSDVGHLTSEEAAHFNLWKGLRAALVSIPDNLAGLGSALSNPFKADEAPHEMNHAVYGLMYQRFGGGIAAFAYLIFVLLYFPCVSTMAAMRREVGKGWAYFSMGWSFALAYGVAVIAYQALTIARHPMSSSAWIIGILAVFTITVGWMIRYARRDGIASSKNNEVQTHVA